MKGTLTLLCSVLICLTNSCVFGQLPPPNKWTATVKIVDEDSAPVAGANVAVSYDLIPRPPDPNQKQYGEFKGLTDTNGVFVASHTDKSLGLGINVTKDGYYRSHTGYQFYFDDKRLNPSFTLTLKKIGNPIPMYAKQAHMIFQQVGKPMGFDLEAGDWVTPYGKGFHTDIIYTLLHRQIISEREYDCALTVTFPNNGDGIIIAPDESAAGSEFKTSRTASENGYQPELDLHYSNTNQPEPVFGYFVRVRTELNPDGTVKSALYGKISGGFRFYAGTISPTSGMGFAYYLNPTPNNRNVEFNPKRNLIKDLKLLEGVSEP